MNLKHLLLIASLCVGSSLLAEPLTWHFRGTALGPGICAMGSDDLGSIYDGTSIAGLEFDLQIFLNTNLRGHKECGQGEIPFEGPFRAQVVIPDLDTGPLPVDLIADVENFDSGGQVDFLELTLLWTSPGPVTPRIQAHFASAISDDPFHLEEVSPERAIIDTEPTEGVEFSGANGLLHICGKLHSFLAKAGPRVVEVPGDGRTPSGLGVVAGTLSDTRIVELFIRGNDDHIYSNGMDRGAKFGEASDFTRWVEVPPGGAETGSEPAAVIHQDALKLFIRGLDDRIYENDFRPILRDPDVYAWSGWSEVFGNGFTLSGPAAVVDNEGTLRLFVRGLDDGIWENDFDGRGWNPVCCSGFTLSRPAAVVYEGILKLFVRGLDNEIWENDFPFTGWDRVHGGGLTLEGPSALVDHGVLKLFVTGLDDGVWENDFDGSSFGEWSEVSSGGSLTSSAPAAVQVFRQIIPPCPPPPMLPATVVGYPTVFLRSQDGRILQGFF